MKLDDFSDQTDKISFLHSPTEIGEKCTGSIDPSYGGGYTKNQQKPTTSFLESLYNVTDNIVDSSWCDYSYICDRNVCNPGMLLLYD